MTLAATNFMAFDAVGEAFGAWCSRFSAKELMALFPPLAEATAKKWRRGCLPSSRHLSAMVERWGQPFIEAVFAPALRRAEFDMLAQLESVEVQIAMMRERVLHESRRRDRLDLAATAAGRSVVGVVGAGSGCGGGDGRCGCNAGGSSEAVGGNGLAALKHGLIGAIGGMILLSAALHGPISDLLDDSGFGGRSVRTVVSMVRVKGRTGRGLG